MHSEVQFKVKHLVISTVSGFFKSFEGSLETESDDFENAAISFALDIDSIDTNQTQRDEHLKSPEFFDAAQFPQITFKSTSFKKTGDDEYALVGDLTIKGVTKTVTLDAEFGGSTDDFYGNTKAGFEVTGKINRKDFGLTWDGVTEAEAALFFLHDYNVYLLSIMLIKIYPENPNPKAIEQVVEVLRKGGLIIYPTDTDDDEIIEYSTDPELIYEKYQALVDMVIDGGYGDNIASTVVDCTNGDFEIIREGKGELELYL
eukprot:gene927-934_t